MPLFTNVHVCKFERKGYSKVTTISFKNNNFIKTTHKKTYYQTRLQDVPTFVAGNLKSLMQKKGIFFVERGGGY